MKTIRIIRGTYGLQKPNSSGVEPKTPSDSPFEISDDEARRLVEMEVAEYYRETSGASGEPGSKGAGGGGSGAGAALTKSALGKQNKASLESLARRRGVDISGASTNAQLADLIWADIQAKGDAVTAADIAEGNGGGGSGGLSKGADGEDGIGGTGTEGNGGGGSDDEEPPTVGAAAPVD